MNAELLKNKKGYTIIETMISVSLFLIIVMSGMGALVNANVLHQKSQDMRSIMDNLTFVIEDMSRNIRTGYNYQCFTNGQTLSPATLGGPKSCAFGWAVAFETATGSTSTYGDQWIFYILNGHVYKSIDGMATQIQLTPNEVVIDSISQFSVLGAEAPNANLQQPFITIRLVGKITIPGKNIDSPFSLQTSLSQRQIDI